MRGLIPARVPAHKARKVQLKSHSVELLDYTLGRISPSQKDAVRSMFVTPNLEAFYSREVRQ